MTVDLQVDALKDFSNAETKEINDLLEGILKDIAKTGQYIHQWHLLKPLFMFKLEKVTEDFLTQNPPLSNDGNTDDEEVNKMIEFRKFLLETFEKFTLAPFTMQRLAELLLNPAKYYKSAPKFFRGLEKNITVVSTIDPVPAAEQKIILKRALEEKSDSDVKPSEDIITSPPAKKTLDNNDVQIDECKLHCNADIDDPQLHSSLKTEQSDSDIKIDEPELRCDESVDERVSISKKEALNDINILSETISHQDKSLSNENQFADITSSSNIENKCENMETDNKETSENVVSTTSDIINDEKLKNEAVSIIEQQTTNVEILINQNEKEVGSATICETSLADAQNIKEEKQVEVDKQTNSNDESMEL